jgi:hypothetical protein
MLRLLGVAALAALVPAAAVSAQTFETVGTRAAGMGGAFVAVADDASAAYWNPAGFATGSYFSLVLDRSIAEAIPRVGPAGSHSSILFAAGMPATGLSYYRLRSTTARPASATDEAVAGRNVAGVGDVRVDNLITHQFGVTLVQSIYPGISVGSTLKLVRGSALVSVLPAGNSEAILDAADDIAGETANKFDADFGVMAGGGRLKAGLTVRNISEPRFDAPGGYSSVRLERQARAGVAVTPAEGWVVAADFDLLENTGMTGRTRDIALGAEGKVAKKAVVRVGTRFNTANTDLVGHIPTAGFGGSYAVTPSILVDAQVTAGSDKAPGGWGVSARFVY